MSDQLSLEVQPRTLAHTRDPGTSHDAAARNRAGKATHRRACLEAHFRQDASSGLIDDEVASLTGLDLIEARRRCTDLRNAGLLEFTRITRTSNMGRQATVSIITHAGREALA